MNVGKTNIVAAMRNFLRHPRAGLKHSFKIIQRAFKRQNFVDVRAMIRQIGRAAIGHQRNVCAGIQAANFANGGGHQNKIANARVVDN